MNGFDKQNLEGKKAEQAVKEMLLNRGNAITDVSNDQQYQKIDVDFIVNDQFKLEVKLDNKAKATGNVFIEVGKDRRSGYFVSWYNKCQADVIAFYDSDIKEACFYNWAKLKELVAGKPVRSYFDGVDNCRTYFIVINKQEAQEALIRTIGG